MAKVLLDKGDLTGKQCIEIIHSAAGDNGIGESENLLKTQVEETIVCSKNGNGKLPEKTKAKPRRKANPELVDK